MCNTVGCPGGGEIEPGQVFCGRCGWPLARGSATVEPGEVHIVGDQSGQTTLRIDNTGTGPLSWEFGSLPRGVAAADAPREVEVGGNQSIVLDLVPAELGPAEQPLPVLLRFRDRAGQHPRDFRPWDPQACWREEKVLVTVHRPRVGPLVVPWRNVLFGHDIDRVVIHATNAGQAALRLRVVAEGGYVVSNSHAEESDAIDLTFEPDVRTAVTIRRPLGASVGPGTLRFLSADGAHEWATVGIRWFERLPAPGEADGPAQVIAIDMGSSKFAAAVFDRTRAGADPELVTWERGEGGDVSDMAPTVVELNADGRPVRAGYQANTALEQVADEAEQPAEGVGKPAPSQRIIRHLKRRVPDSDERSRAAIRFLLRAILKRIAEQHGVRTLQEAVLVFTVPAFDMGPVHEAHKAAYLDHILEAGRPYRLSQEHIRFYPEPECAAAEHLHHLQSDPCGELPQNGWICVLDIGAYTTDVAFARVGFPGGKVEFHDIINIGYPIAGDYIDDRLLAWCLDRWAQRNVLESHDSRQVVVAREKENRSALLAKLREFKEALYAGWSEANGEHEPPESVTIDLFARDEAQLTLTREDVGQRVRAMTAAMFEEGESALGEGAEAIVFEAPAVNLWLEERGPDLELAGPMVELLFQSGGTAHIPDFGQALAKRVLGAGTRLCLLRDPRLDVVRGAARRPEMRTEHILPGELLAKWDDRPDADVILPEAAVIQSIEDLRSGPVMPGATLGLALQLRLGDDLIDLFETKVTNGSTIACPARLGVDFRRDGCLMVSLEWFTAEPQPILTREIIQRIPSG